MTDDSSPVNGENSSSDSPGPEGPAPANPAPGPPPTEGPLLPTAGPNLTPTGLVRPGARPWGPAGQWPPTSGQWPPAGQWGPPPAPGQRPPAAWPGAWAYPPAAQLDFTPPGRRHPPTGPRAPLSLEGRAAPGLYAAGLFVGWPLFGLLLYFEVAIRIGLPLVSPSFWLVEAVSALSAGGLIAAAVAQARQRQADGWQDYAGPSPFLATAAVLAMSTALQLLLLKALASSPGLAVSDAALTLLVMILNVGVYVGLVHFLAVRRGALTWRDIARPARLAPDPSDPPQAPARYPAAAARPRFFRLPVDVLAGAVLVIPALIATGFVVRTLMILLRLKESDVSSPVPTVFSVDERWFVFVAVAILAPIGEEVFFRGFATNAWARSLSRPNALVRAGLFFAFIHIIDVGSGSGDLILRTSIVAFATRLPVSFALSWLYVSRRSIYASAALHACFNGLILLIAWS